MQVKFTKLSNNIIIIILHNNNSQDGKLKYVSDVKFRVQLSSHIAIRQSAVGHVK